MKLSICFERTDGSVSEHESSFPYELTDTQVASLFREVMVLAEALVRKTDIKITKVEIDEVAPPEEPKEEPSNLSSTKGKKHE